jgi:hypothetical protein
MAEAISFVLDYLAGPARTHRLQIAGGDQSLHRPVDPQRCPRQQCRLLLDRAHRTNTRWPIMARESGGAGAWTTLGFGG